jgi:hypothetical protein
VEEEEVVVVVVAESLRGETECLLWLDLCFYDLTYYALRMSLYRDVVRGESELRVY